MLVGYCHFEMEWRLCKYFTCEHNIYSEFYRIHKSGFTGCVKYIGKFAIFVNKRRLAIHYSKASFLEIYFYAQRASCAVVWAGISYQRFNLFERILSKFVVLWYTYSILTWLQYSLHRQTNIKKNINKYASSIFGHFKSYEMTIYYHLVSVHVFPIILNRASVPSDVSP